MRGLFFTLHWRDIDPATHAFDPAPAREIAERLVQRLAKVLPKNRDRIREDESQTSCERDINIELAARYGPWILGWTWSSGEPGGGGPVNAWCCPRDSLLPGNESIHVTVDRIALAISEWRQFLEYVAREQTRLNAETNTLLPETAIEIIAAHYVPIVVERTQCSDAWYNLYNKLLQWHFEALGHDDLRITKAITQVTSGHFKSWIEPEPQVVKNVVAKLALGVAEAMTAPPDTTDALLSWLKLRRKTDWKSTYGGGGPVRVDGHRAFIDKYDLPRSAERARRFQEALQFVRDNSEKPLTWSLLCEAQRRVLGQDEMDFRKGDAFAKGGRERYGLGPKTRTDFERCLAEANDSAVPPPARAARVYLDICFFHPFIDGNARAARLALDHVLTQAGLALAIADPLFLFALHAGDDMLAWRFHFQVSALAGPLSAQSSPWE